MISVITPTYNRCYTLEILHDSLKYQTYRDFEWIVVDDGSTDGTEKLIEGFKADARFPIRYRKQENSGKHVAINVAAELARGEWFFIVDSDDFLPSDSLERNAYYLAQIERDPAYAGVSGLCARPDGSVLVGADKFIEDLPEDVRARFRERFIDATPQQYRESYKMPGDRAEIVRTELVRKFRFPKFEQEKFVSEYYLWQSISNAGLLFRWFNEPTYFAEYLDDGLTKNMRDIMLGSPLGRSFVDNFTMSSRVPARTKLRSAVNYTRYGRLGGKSLKELFVEAHRKMMFLLGIVPAFVFPLKAKWHE